MVKHLRLTKTTKVLPLEGFKLIYCMVSYFMPKVSIVSPDPYGMRARITKHVVFSY